MCPLEMGNNSISIISELLLRIRLISTCFRGVTLVTSMPLPEPFLTRIYLATMRHKVTTSLTSIPRYISHFRYITLITSINCQQCRCLKWYKKKSHNMIYIKVIDKHIFGQYMLSHPEAGMFYTLKVMNIVWCHRHEEVTYPSYITKWVLLW